jgi:hypothetical protein
MKRLQLILYSVGIRFFSRSVVIVIALSAFVFFGCGKPYFEVDVQQLQEKIYDPTAIKYEGLQESMGLYLDHSTCVIEARKNSKVFKNLMGQLGLYTDTLFLIKGSDFEKVPNTDKSATSTDVYNIINGISSDIPFADIGQAVKIICENNSQAILITDCEYIDRNGKNQDGFPFLSGSFKDWVKAGHSIYIVVEPYQEKNKGKMFDKKRFYFIFTDDRMEAPVCDNMLHEIQSLLQDNVCKLFKLTNSDITVQHSKDMVAEDLTFTVKDFPGFEYVDVSDDWNSIREYIMKLDEYGEPLPEEKPVPIIKNLVFNDGENYFINDVEIVATNITAQYLSKDCDAAENLKLDCKDINLDPIDMSEGFKLDKNALKNHKLNVLLTDKVFDYLTDEYGGNLIRLDFVVTKVGLQDNFDYDMFTWQSLNNNEKAICVSKSIENVLYDVEIVPTSKDRKIIHTVFLRTESYK